MLNKASVMSAISSKLKEHFIMFQNILAKEHFMKRWSIDSSKLQKSKPDKHLNSLRIFCFPYKSVELIPVQSVFYKMIEQSKNHFFKVHLIVYFSSMRVISTHWIKLQWFPKKDHFEMYLVKSFSEHPLMMSFCQSN